MLDLILTILFGWAGYWKFKNGKIALGIVWLITFGAFGFGWLFDIIFAFVARLNNNKVTTKQPATPVNALPPKPAQVQAAAPRPIAQPVTPQRSAAPVPPPAPHPIPQQVQQPAAPVPTPAPRPVSQPVQQRPTTTATAPAPCSVSQPVRQQAAAPAPNMELLRGLEETAKILPDPDGSLSSSLRQLKMIYEAQQATDDPVQTLKPDFVDPFPIKKTLGGGFRYEGKDKYLIVFKDEKEYFDGDIVAELGDLILVEGFRVNSEAVALIGQDGVLALRKIECGVEAARILPSGVGIVVTDDDKLLIMSKEGTKSKNFPFWSVPEEQRAITDEGCASIDEDENGEDAYVLRFFCFETQTAWRKKIKCSFPDDETYNTVEPHILVSSDFVTVETPDGVVHRFSLDGAKL